jgi:hypothetical protein
MLFSAAPAVRVVLSCGWMCVFLSALASADCSCCCLRLSSPPSASFTLSTSHFHFLVNTALGWLCVYALAAIASSTVGTPALTPALVCLVLVLSVARVHITCFVALSAAACRCCVRVRQHVTHLARFLAPSQAPPFPLGPPPPASTLERLSPEVRVLCAPCARRAV